MPFGAGLKSFQKKPSSRGPGQLQDVQGLVAVPMLPQHVVEDHAHLSVAFCEALLKVSVTVSGLVRETHSLAKSCSVLTSLKQNAIKTWRFGSGGVSATKPGAWGSLCP